MAPTRAVEQKALPATNRGITCVANAIAAVNEALQQLGAPLEDGADEHGVSVRRLTLEGNLRMVRKFLETLSAIYATVAMAHVAMTEAARFVWMLFAGPPIII